MPKVKIVFGSVLKPVHDPRFLEKLALSIGQTNKYEINIIGFSGKNLPRLPNIRLYPVFNFKRISWNRLAAPWKFYKYLIKLKPELIIVNTYELLIVIVIYKILFGSKLLYDVQENYYRNIRYNSDLPGLIRLTWSLVARAIEKATAPWIDHFLLAEKHYQQELHFVRHHCTIIENKAFTPVVIPDRPPTPRNRLRLLYSGTIAVEYGIIEAIEWVIRLQQLYSDVSFLIIGHCPVNSTWLEVQRLTRDKPNIQTTGGPDFVPHPQILDAIRDADYGLLPYRLNPAIRHCMPTRMYEYLANHLPCIVQDNPPWRDLVRKYQAGLSVDFSKNPSATLIRQLRECQFYQDQLPNDLYWPSESHKWIELVSSLQNE